MYLSYIQYIHITHSIRTIHHFSCTLRKVHKIRIQNFAPEEEDVSRECEAFRSRRVGSSSNLQVQYIK